jgi:hypothetical protein
VLGWVAPAVVEEEEEEEEDECSANVDSRFTSVKIVNIYAYSKC